MMFLRIKNLFFETLFPVRCVSCAQEGEWFCGDCASKVELNQKQFCPTCWEESLGGKTCSHCTSHLDGLRVAASYERNPELAKVVKNLKYKFSKNLAENLSKVLLKAFSQKNYENERVVSFVPLHKKRLRWRGFNQAELLASSVAKNLNLPLENLLVRDKNTEPQAKLSREERLQNLKDAFGLAPNFEAKGKTVILIDDIASTSTTLTEAAKVLKKGGAGEVWGLVLARG